MRILFITTSNLATNPRIVKEIRLAVQQGFSVSVICFSFDNWSGEINEKLKADLADNIDYTEIAGNRKPWMPWLMSTVLFKLSAFALKFVPDDDYWLSVRSNKRSWLLIRCLARLPKDFDIVVAHNIGSFYPALKFARRIKSRFGVDLEDYHPGESNEPNAIHHTEKLLKFILPKADYVTAASPLILKESMRVAPANSRKEVIMNLFPADEFIEPVETRHDTLTLVWFSQNISFGRGLEHVLPVISGISGVSLHLFGNCHETFYEKWLGPSTNVFIHAALPQRELHKRLSEFDVGLAIEPGKDRNNELAISNKMLAYFQAGLFILATDTPAQKCFLKEHAEAGRLVSLYSDGLKASLHQLIAQKQEIRQVKKKRFLSTQKFNWESESKKLLDIWESLYR